MAAGEEYRRPTAEYCDYKKDPDNYMQLLLDIPGLKKKLIKKDISNGEVNLEFPSDTSITVTVELNVKNAPNKFKYVVTKLPDPIETDKKKSYCKVNRHDEVEVLLHKKSPRPWNEQLRANILE